MTRKRSNRRKKTLTKRSRWSGTNAIRRKKIENIASFRTKKTPPKKKESNKKKQTWKRLPDTSRRSGTGSRPKASF